MGESPLQQIVCCMGQPVAGNPTQFMMERAFAAAGLDWRYLTLEVSPQNLPDAIRGLRAMGFAGANFTIPHKVAVVPHLDELSPAAEMMGAVNCVHRVDDRLIGENTDGKGFLQSLREKVDPAGKQIVLFGAGGAARAIAVELALAEAAHIKIINRTAERGQPLAQLLLDRTRTPAEFIPWEGLFALPPETGVVINATSIGMGDHSQRVAVDPSTFLPHMIAADVVFNPPSTQFLREASAHGCKTIDGLGMLVNQGIISFKIWTSVVPDAQVMREALEEYLEI